MRQIGTAARMSLGNLYRKPGHLIRRLQQIAVALFMLEAERFDLTPIQYASLAAIRAVPDVLSTRSATAPSTRCRSLIAGVSHRPDLRHLDHHTGTAGSRSGPVPPEPSPAGPAKRLESPPCGSHYRAEG